MAPPIFLHRHRLLASDGFSKFEENCSPNLVDSRAMMAAAIAMKKIVRTILVFIGFS
jgi:hypothetical protein